jgi:hypothetical protein
MDRGGNDPAAIEGDISRRWRLPLSAKPLTREPP